MKWIKKHLISVILIAVILIGLGIMAYPSFSNYWNSFHQSRAIMTYAQNVANMNSEDYEKILQAAKDYNAKLTEKGNFSDFTEEEESEYNSLLNVDGSGIMGYINIPKIDISLPVYHGTSDQVLQTSIGHLTETSLPVGGESTHCVLSGHRGLPSARLFTDLDKLEEGDTFTLTILNETLTYEVDQIRIVLPDDLSDLQIVEGQDLCTLVTCTPYGINTHRLLVRGHRVANANGDANVIADAIRIRPIYIAPFLAVPILIILIVILFFRTGKRAQKNKISEDDYLKMMHLEQPETDIDEEAIRREAARREAKQRKRRRRTRER